MGKLMVGASKVCISPTPDMFPIEGRWSPMPQEGIYFDLYARGLAVSDGETKVLFLTLETGMLGDEFKKQVSDQYGLPVENIMVISTHNHGGPNSPAMDPIVRKGAEDAARIAFETMRPARMGYDEGKSYINVNRDQEVEEDGLWAHGEAYDKPSDKTAALLRFDDEVGKTIAVLMNFACHATLSLGAVDSDGKAKVCADFPGFACDFLEKRYGNGAVVLWTSGAAGNQSPIGLYRNLEHYLGNENNTQQPTPDGWTYHYTQYMGERHAVECNKTLRNIVCDQSDVVVKAAQCDALFDGQDGIHPERHFLVTAFVAQNTVVPLKFMAPDLLDGNKIKDRAAFLCDPVPNGKKIPCLTQMFRIGDVYILSAAAELYNEIATYCIENASVEHLFVITNTAGHDGVKTGYVQSDNAAKDKSYQHFAQVHPGNCNDIMLGAMNELLKKVNE